jgi:hypothetical protein
MQLGNQRPCLVRCPVPALVDADIPRDQFRHPLLEFGIAETAHSISRAPSDTLQGQRLSPPVSMRIQMPLARASAAETLEQRLDPKLLTLF